MGGAASAFGGGKSTVVKPKPKKGKKGGCGGGAPAPITIQLGDIEEAPQIQVGDTFPDIEVHSGFPPRPVKLGERLKGKKTIVLGLPAAFAPTAHDVQIPGYLDEQSELRELGVDEVLVYCVNDGAVMRAWGLARFIQGSLVSFLADPTGTLTKSLGLSIMESGLEDLYGNHRSKRAAMYVVDGVVKVLNISGTPEDPAGDEDPTATCVEAMISAIGKLREE